LQFFKKGIAELVWQILQLEVRDKTSIRLRQLEHKGLSFRKGKWEGEKQGSPQDLDTSIQQGEPEAARHELHWQQGPA
jgi:hypothetical protein